MWEITDNKGTIYSGIAIKDKLGRIFFGEEEYFMPA